LFVALFAGSITASDGSQLQRQKTVRLAALCEASKQLQSRLQNETQRFHSDFTSQGFNSHYICFDRLTECLSVFAEVFIWSKVDKNMFKKNFHSIFVASVLHVLICWTL